MKCWVFLCFSCLLLPFPLGSRELIELFWYCKYHCKFESRASVHSRTLHELNFFAENLDLNLNIEDRSNAPMTDTQNLILVLANISSPAGYLSCLLLLGISAFFLPLLVILYLIISLESRQFLLDEIRLLRCCMGATPEFSTQIEPTVIWFTDVPHDVSQ